MTGLVFGKFMPLHNGHLALIDFARKRCDRLIVLLCAEPTEPISAEQRMHWLRQAGAEQSDVELRCLRYDPELLPNTSESSREVSRVWAEEFRRHLPPLDVVFTSEPYGEFVAQYLKIRHEAFDPQRLHEPIAASLIRQRPWAYWSYLPSYVRPFFVTKIALHGTESTGKSTLAEKLAVHYHTIFAPEAAREVVAHTSSVRPEDLPVIAEKHALVIQERANQANALLFVDTTLHTTRAYSRFLFGQELEVPAWIETANSFQLHLFLSADCAYVQDGTRLSEQERLRLESFHRAELEQAGINYYEITTTGWEERYEQALQTVQEFLG